MEDSTHNKGLIHINIRDCGAGQGELCCAYIMAGPDGTVCGREMPNMKSLLALKALRGDMNAKRLPEEPYPACQIGRVV